MKKSLLYIVFMCFFVFHSWGQEKNVLLDSQKTVKEDATPKLSRFLQNIELEKDYDFNFDRNFLNPKGISFRKFFRSSSFTTMQYSKDIKYMETLYPNSKYPSGILMEGSNRLTIKSFPEVDP
ncbi:hypothetical protein ACFQ3R_04765 [Mesonia ostreae]|uniref:Uncharacterized protein n=1 Tax=Mesonia ostreae TaxID=861110 RepID=A0ABU2KK86_9FLAO|nr:hypothetical protein [Mesonia ostreae]MDT0295126.1 hypothetical protein [Mesonia ostreae]